MNSFQYESIISLNIFEFSIDSYHVYKRWSEVLKFSIKSQGVTNVILATVFEIHQLGKPPSILFLYRW